MLYFAFDLRQQPAFYGVFQQFWNWPFLADLSASDHFLGEFSQPLTFSLLCIPVNITGLNILPLLMGVIFFIQQKYMTPPPSPTMSKEMLQQQKIMKVMMVVMFPIMLYSAPSGLTLYILTSSIIGILESRWIRAHIKEMDLEAPNRKVVVNEKQKKPRGVMARAYARALEAAEERRRQKLEPPPSKFKKRK
jgi:YidC/Oxa1 family membrane protein insertase